MKQGVVIKDYFDLSFGQTVDIVEDKTPFVCIVKAHGNRESEIVPAEYIQQCDDMFNYSTNIYAKHED